MLDSYKEKQFLFYNYILNSFNDNKLSHAYLFELNDVSYGYNLVNDFAKFLLCNGIYNKKICDLIDKNCYDNYYMIESENQIKKDQILELQEKFSYKSIDNNKKVYIIKDASLLNDYSANSLLKFLEEPDNDIIAILVTNNLNDIKDTIISRCQVISLVNNEKFDYKKLFNYYNYENNDLSINEFIELEYNKFLDFYLNIEKNKVLILKDKNIYDYNNHFFELLKYGLYLYFDLINAILYVEKEKYILDDMNLSIFLNSNNYNSVLKKIDLISKFMNLANKNINKNLFFDNFVIQFGGVNND